MLRRAVFLLLAIMLPFLLLVVRVPAQQPRSGGKGKSAPGPTFDHDIRPLLVSQCVGCHNRTTVGSVALSGGLALDSYEAMMRGVAAGGKGSRAVILPGKPDESELVRRLETKDTSRRMPKGGDPLPADKIALVKRWITLGAPRGAGGKSLPDSSTPPPAPPGPVLDVLFPTSLVPPADLVTPATPKDARLSIALPIGPLAPVTALAYSPDGKTLAVGTYRAVVLWDMTAGRVARVLGEPVGTVHAVAWSVDGSLLAAAGGAPGALGEIRLYDVKASCRPLPLLTGHTDVVYSVAFSPNGKILASASQDKTVRTWDIAGAKPLRTIRSHSDVVYQVRFTPDGKSIVSCGMDRAVRQFEAETGKMIRSFEGHESAATALAVSPDGKFFVSAGVDPRLRWWNPADGNTVRFSDGHSGQVNDIVFSKDGKLVAAASADHTIRVWNGNDGGGPLKTFADAPDWNYRVAISPDGRFVAGGGADGAVRLWQIEPGAFRAALIAVPTRSAAGVSAEWAVMTPAGYFATSPGWDKKPRLSLAGLSVKTRAAALLASLRSLENALRSLRGEAVEPPKLPTPLPSTQPDAKKKGG